MKAVNYSWWIGAIISTILTLTLTGGPAQDNPGMLILIGVINGVFWGWIIGLIIDKLIANFQRRDLVPEKVANVQIQNREQENSYKGQKKYVSMDAEIAFGMAEIVTGNRTNRTSSPKNVLRCDGYYVASKNVEGYNKNFLLFFTSKGFVALAEPEEFDTSDYSNEDYKQVITEGENLSEIEVSNHLTNYFQEEDFISMKFYDPTESSNIDPIEKVSYEDPVVYNKWSGKIIPNGLLLDLEVSRFSYALKDYEKQQPIHNLKFNFVPVGMN
ncbi:hypothetical protein DET49_102185 [Salegentibacter sp. 24]|uniref:hypothetical protein n=1 Tax=Salegentibacter sp. 24 TaxID=2183986 RepID=UPI00105F6FD3|nr:hypothetical protein [Salegentibacter sp. 24]TDN95299.1 hypothetical protein DET49_102185 [Salegentibacter sp. 24]